MDIQTTKIELVQKLLNETRQSVLEQIEQLLAGDEIVAYTISGEPLTKSDYNLRLQAAEHDFEEGRVIDHEDLKKQVESWGK